MLYSVVPGMFGFAILATSTYLRSRRLAAPLWYSRKSFKFLAISLFSFLIMGYVILVRDMNMNEKR